MQGKPQMTYYLFVNFKAYEEGTGQKALALSKLLSTFSSEAAEVVPVVQALDLRQIAKDSALKIFAQHADPIKFGPGTGRILPEALKAAGAYGTVLNHAENKVSNDALRATIARCAQAGLKVLCCAENLQRAKEIAAFSPAPDFIAIEPPELIGGEVSVSSAKPELISGSVAAIAKINPKIIVITGAGIKNQDDVAKAIELGTKGIFVSSGIVRAPDQEYAVKQLLGGFPQSEDSGSMP